MKSDPPQSLAVPAESHLRDILALSIGHGPDRKALVVADARSGLSALLASAYRRCLPDAAFLDFDAAGPGAVRAAFEGLSPGDLVVLVQSSSFRLETFRVRLELFKRGLKVIEHPHLERMRGEEARLYVDALAYDPGYYRGVGRALKARIDAAREIVLDTGGEALVFPGPFEDAKLNVGDYRGMRNVGGLFPIGEVFTEAKDLEAVSGRLRVSIFADVDFMANRPERPATLIVEAGRVVGAGDATPELERVLADIRADEGEVWVRELGFGLNRAFSPDRMVRDIGTLERMCGVHLSLGAKHAVYPKPNFRRKDGRHHVDVFAATADVRIDGESVWDGSAWTLPPAPWR
jgi:hypothetical protein